MFSSYAISFNTKVLVEEMRWNSINIKLFITIIYFILGNVTYIDFRKNLLAPDIDFALLNETFPLLEMIDIRYTEICLQETYTYTVITDCTENITPNFEYTTWITKSKDNDDDIDDAPLTTEFYPRPTPRIRKQKTLPTTNIISTTSSLPYAKNTFRPIKVPQKSSFTTDKQLSANLTTFSFKEEQQTTIHPDISAIKNVGFSMLITGVICLILAICLILSLIALSFCEILCCKKKKRSRKRSRSCASTKPQMTCLTEICSTEPLERAKSFTGSLDSLSSLTVFSKVKTT